MKAVFKLCLGLIFYGCSTTPENKGLRVDSKSGYKDLTFQSSSQPLLQKGNFFLTKTNSCNTVSEYKCRQGPYMSLGPIQFDELRLTYAQDSLSRVVLYKAYNQEQWTTLTRAMREEYGEPTEIDQRMLWDSEMTLLRWSGKENRVNLEGSSNAGIILSMHSVSGLKRNFDQEEKCRHQEQQKVKTDL